MADFVALIHSPKHNLNVAGKPRKSKVERQDSRTSALSKSFIVETEMKMLTLCNIVQALYDPKSMIAFNFNLNRFLEFYTEHILKKINCEDDERVEVVQSILILHVVSINCEKDRTFTQMYVCMLRL